MLTTKPAQLTFRTTWQSLWHCARLKVPRAFQRSPWITTFIASPASMQTKVTRVILAIGLKRTGVMRTTPLDISIIHSFPTATSVTCHLIIPTWPSILAAGRVLSAIKRSARTSFVVGRSCREPFFAFLNGFLEAPFQFVPSLTPILCSLADPFLFIHSFPSYVSVISLGPYCYSSSIRTSNQVPPSTISSSTVILPCLTAVYHARLNSYANGPTLLPASFSIPFCIAHSSL